MEEKFNTEYAQKYTGDTDHGIDDMKAAWWELFSNYRAKKWRNELKALVDRTGTEFPYVCRYIGLEPSEQPGFYRKMPRVRETFIGIGMAYKLPLDTINRWLSKYGAKKKLYIKDVLSDLIWIYLITVNCNDHETDTNYYSIYDSCQKAVGEIYSDVWNDIMSESVDTVVLENSMKQIGYDRDFTGLRSFVVENIDAFKTAYIKPRTLLYKYIEKILEVRNLYDGNERKWTLSSLRGYLDDSMINYLSGSRTTINVRDGVRGNITSGIKYIPKTKRAHISMCLALGMDLQDLDRYLEMMGYSPLDSIDSDEGALILMLNQWNNEHPQQAKFRAGYINTDGPSGDDTMSPEEQLAAVDQMLELRMDLKEMYEQACEKLREEGVSDKRFRKFPYFNE